MKAYKSGNHSSLFSLVVPSLVLVTALLALTGCYNFTIFDVPGAYSTAAYGINNAGQVVGYYWVTPSGVGPFRGFIRDSNGSFTMIDVPGASSAGTVAQGINNVGQAVGNFDDDAPPDRRKNHGFVRDTGGGFTTFDFPGVAHSGGSLAINDAGQVVGGSYNPSGLRSFVRDSSGSFIPFDFPGATMSQAWGINNAGQIVGLYEDTITGTARGFLRDSSGSFTMIDVPGASYTEPFGINNAGQIVGYFFTLGVSGFHGFLRDTSGTFTMIDVPGSTHTEARGINDAGQISGFFYDTSGGAHGFIATPN